MKDLQSLKLKTHLKLNNETVFIQLDFESLLCANNMQHRDSAYCGPHIVMHLVQQVMSSAASLQV